MYFTVSTYVFPIQFTFLFQNSVFPFHFFCVRKTQEGTHLARETRFDGKPLFFQESLEKLLLAQPFPVEVQQQENPAFARSGQPCGNALWSAVRGYETRVHSYGAKRRDVVLSFHQQNLAFRGGKHFLESFKLALVHFSRNPLWRIPFRFLAQPALC